MSSIKTILICNDPKMAVYAASCGVTRIMIDCERNGKLVRQAGVDTVISSHEIRDAFQVVSSLIENGFSNAMHRVVIRLNSLYPGSAREIDMAIEAGVGMIMLPYFHAVSEVKQFVELVSGRVGVIPLVETARAIEEIEDIVKIEGVNEVYIGLNDLHRDLGMRHIFQPLALGYVDRASEICRRANIPFGFGGIGRLGTGEVPSGLILSEHRRLGSRCVILSRSFHGRSVSLDDMKSKIDLPGEIQRLSSAWNESGSFSVQTLDDNRRALATLVAALAKENE